MSIDLKTPQQIEIMAQGGKKLGKIRDRLAAMVKPGFHVIELEKTARNLIKQAGAVPNFCLTKNYPYSICCSINEEIVHGMPKDKVIKEGDLVGIDVGMLYKGWHLDTALTVGAGKILPQDQKLLDVTKSALDKAIGGLKSGIKLGKISNLIQTYVEKNGFSVLRNLSGHGIGRELHEEPKVPNFGSPEDGPVLQEGMVLAIEPMVSAGDFKTTTKDDGWTVVMADGSKGAHFEHTVAITKSGAQILTK